MKRVFFVACGDFAHEHEVGRNVLYNLFNFCSGIAFSRHKADNAIIFTGKFEQSRIMAQHSVGLAFPSGIINLSNLECPQESLMGMCCTHQLGSIMVAVVSVSRTVIFTPTDTARYWASLVVSSLSGGKSFQGMDIITNAPAPDSPEHFIIEIDCDSSTIQIHELKQ